MVCIYVSMSLFGTMFYSSISMRLLDVNDVCMCSESLKLDNKELCEEVFETSICGVLEGNIIS